MSSKGNSSSSGGEEEEAEGREEKDESLDMLSPRFDPLKALYAPEKVKVPCLKAPLYDNTSKFGLGPSGIFIRGPAKKKIKDTPVQPSTSRSIPPALPAPSRTGAKGQNVFTRMEQMSGPLALLRDCMERRVRIKVFTRSVNGIRGHCIAFVAAFDKMWNLALEDVREVWTRKIKRKSVPMGPLVDSRDLVRPARPPRIVVTKVDKKTERCERYVSQLLLRGEQVAIISLLD